MESNCPFCDPENFKDRLIAEVDGFYVVATLGQITNSGYVLIIPKRHVPCIGAMEPSELDSAGALLHRVDRAIMDEYPTNWEASWPGLMFEHGIVGQTVKHAHIHVMPGYCDLTPLIKRGFPKECSERQFAAYLQDLGKLYKEKLKPYLFWRDAKTLFSHSVVCWDPPAPPQYLRIVAAEALGRPERANWREMDPELDKKLGDETVRRLKPYF